MRQLLASLSFAAALLVACQGEAATDPKTLYRFEAEAAPAALEAGAKGRLRLAIRPTAKGAHVKPETPFRGKLSATGPLRLERTEIGYRDHSRIEDGGPVFEIPFEATDAGTGSLKADLVFFVCTAEACLRTTEQVEIPVQVK